MRRVLVVLALVLIAAKPGPPGGGGGGLPENPDPDPYEHVVGPDIAVLGYMGASQASYGAGSRFNQTGLYANVGLGNPPGPKGSGPGIAAGCYWTQLPTQGGTFACDLWPAYFEPQLPATAVWWLAAMTDDEARNGFTVAGTRAKLDYILGQIRARTSAPVYVSTVPPMQAGNPCKTLDPTYQVPVRAALSDMVAEGLVLEGPVLPDLTAQQKLNRCHPNAAGIAVWGQALGGFAWP